MYSVVLGGKVLDYHFKKLKAGHYAFYIGDILVGQVLILRSGWSAVGYSPSKLCPVHGFNSRLRAAEFLLCLEGYVQK